MLSLGKIEGIGVNMYKIDKYIREKAQVLGIDMIGFTNCQPLNNLEEYLRERKEQNLTTEFEEANLEKRLDPKLTLESCKSIIVMALSYNIDYRPKANEQVSGSLSKSSWGEDYHKVLKKKMDSLIEEIKKIEDFNYKAFVDTGPLLDRELAYRAGLGYYGKNCSIINKEYGSYIFLAYILTDLDLEITQDRVDNDCGDCILCLKACPTGALQAPYKINPKKCISYLTQTKELINEDLRHKMGRSIYGCDICQQVCPKNKGVKISQHQEFVPRKTGGLVDIEELFAMSNREFKLKYGHKAGAWRGRNVFIRNAIIALSNMKKKESNQLLSSLQTESDLLSPYIDWALEKLEQENK